MNKPSISSSALITNLYCHAHAWHNYLTKFYAHLAYLIIGEILKYL